MYVYLATLVFVFVDRLSLVVVSGSYYSFPFSHCDGVSCCRAQALEHRLRLRTRRLSCSMARAIFPDQGSNHVPCFGRQILNHRQSPIHFFI